jgi:glutamate-1-semialdehyde aminotransferase
MPLSAIVGRRDIMQRMAPPDNIFYSGTFAGEALSLAAAIATIDKLERERVIEHLWQVGQVMHAKACTWRVAHEVEDLVWFEGESPRVRIKFRDDEVGKVFRREMIASGTLVIASHNVCFAHGLNEITRVAKSYDHTFGVLRKTFK